MVAPPSELQLVPQVDARRDTELPPVVPPSPTLALILPPRDDLLVAVAAAGTLSVYCTRTAALVSSLELAPPSLRADPAAGLRPTAAIAGVAHCTFEPSGVTVLAIAVRGELVLAVLDDPAGDILLFPAIPLPAPFSSQVPLAGTCMAMAPRESSALWIGLLGGGALVEVIVPLPLPDRASMPDALKRVQVGRRIAPEVASVPGATLGFAPSAGPFVASSDGRVVDAHGRELELDLELAGYSRDQVRSAVVVAGAYSVLALTLDDNRLVVASAASCEALHDVVVSLDAGAVVETVSACGPEWLVVQTSTGAMHAYCAESRAWTGIPLSWPAEGAQLGAADGVGVVLFGSGEVVQAWARRGGRLQYVRGDMRGTVAPSLVAGGGRGLSKTVEAAAAAFLSPQYLVTGDGSGYIRLLALDGPQAQCVATARLASGYGVVALAASARTSVHAATFVTLDAAHTLSVWSASEVPALAQRATVRLGEPGAAADAAAWAAVPTQITPLAPAPFLAMVPMAAGNVRAALAPLGAREHILVSRDASCLIHYGVSGIGGDAELVRLASYETNEVWAGWQVVTGTALAAAIELAVGGTLTLTLVDLSQLAVVRRVELALLPRSFSTGLHTFRWALHPLSLGILVLVRNGEPWVLDSTGVSPFPTAASGHIVDVRYVRKVSGGLAVVAVDADGVLWIHAPGTSGPCPAWASTDQALALMAAAFEPVGGHWGGDLGADAAGSGPTVAAVMAGTLAEWGLGSVRRSTLEAILACIQEAGAMPEA
ncbi:uncharacterized protein AMSG_00780 [Thecamonas trahens ATCC 50062]|uniref:Uncharacterized protein n=1 Tax=Thecamonas trahens ATCC 50062 TaxID=461836 RepID=A0A0L0DEA5_THETB|nr:hypothetical protein AMSG_00780 [Thecamonas trahens ATCC 50062]KNC50619.1 hypothetical protein AMSG_00780 [Thecamonas trahens ATCC 50062]|eukprot:XP_013762506.1 hypothetical protein AMSG_00780 [Thecamonas trahens ATCC 50062]